MSKKYLFGAFTSKTLITLVISFTLGSSVSGCSYINKGATAVKDWGYGVGEKMPTNGRRCDSGLFCFGDDKKSSYNNSPTRRSPIENTLNSAPKPNPYGNYSPKSTAQNPGEAAFIEAAKKRMVPPPGMPSNSQFAPPPPPPNMAQIPPFPPARNRTAAGFPPPPPMNSRFAPPPDMPPMAMGNNTAQPPIFKKEKVDYNSLVEEKRMKPWEVSPDWEDDNEPSPMDKIQQQIGW